MAYKTADRVYETSTTTGTGDYTLDGAQTGFQSFASGIGANNLCPYFATDGTNWEVGIGTVVAAPNRLQRTILIASSNAGAAVNWGAGTRKIRCGMPAGNSPRNALESRTSNTQLAQADFAKTIVIASGTFSQTFAAASALGDGWYVYYRNFGTGVITLDPNASETIDGATTVTLQPGEGCMIVSNGTALYTLGRNAWMTIVQGGLVAINDNSNANMTIGLTINQGANDDEILALKSSDVAHGITSYTETDTFALISKKSALSGGCSMRGFSEDVVAIELVGFATVDDTSKSIASVGAGGIAVSKKSGTSDGAMGANANLFTVKNFTDTKFIFDADGDSHQDVGTTWTNFDDHEDVELLHALSVHVSRPGDPIKRTFGEFLKTNRRTLERLKLVTFNKDGHHFVNMSKLAMLLTGAVRQLGAQSGRHEKKVRALSRELSGVRGQLARLVR